MKFLALLYAYGMGIPIIVIEINVLKQCIEDYKSDKDTAYLILICIILFAIFSFVVFLILAPFCINKL